MKYCRMCKKVYEDTEIMCPCAEESCRSTLENIPDNAPEPKCHKCGSTESLHYYKGWNSIITEKEYGNEFKCGKCEEELNRYIALQEAINYLVINNEEETTTLYDDKHDLESFLEQEVKANSGDGEPQLDYLIILKLEPLSFDYKKKLKVEDFKNPKNRHIVIVDGEPFFVEDAFTPDVSFDGGFSVGYF